MDKKLLNWWEYRRLFYNIIMAICGYLSLKIAYVSIPLFYILIGITLNILYSVMWLIDVALHKHSEKSNSGSLFLLYMCLSMLSVLGFSFYLLLPH